MRSVAAATLAVLFASQAFAQEPEATPAPDVEEAGSLETMSLEDLLEVRLEVAARKARTLRESPAVVTLVTREEMMASGARDLSDILRRVPGFEFGIDVGGVVGIGFRGNWGHEGKILLMLDGQELNETLYSTLQFGNHLPVDAIEKIEIVRGPGSAIYGGYAELAVINVITRGAKSFGGNGGGEAGVLYGQGRETFARRNATLSYGRTMGDLQISLSGMFGQGVRSSADYTDFYGDTFDMQEDSGNSNAYLNVGVAWKGLSTRFIYDDYRLDSRDGYDVNYAKAYRSDFVSALGEIRYDAKIGETLTVTPKLNYKRQIAWRTLDKDPDGPFYDKTAERYTGGIAASWDPAESVNVLGGFEAYQDRAFLNDTDLVGYQTDFQGKNQVGYTNLAGYAQALWDAKVASLAVGARYEQHSEFGDSFVPRAALVKVVDRFHVKLLASRAFRAPGIENINVGPGIQPERTTVIEAETGYKVSDDLFVSGNVFDVTIEDPIVYFYDPVTDAEGYANFDRTGTRGIEVEMRATGWSSHAIVSLSLYSARGKNEVELYEVPGNDGALLGMPQIKLVFSGATRLTKDISLDGSAILLGPRAGYLEGDGAGGSEIGEADPVLFVNAFAWYHGLGLQGFDAGFGVYNLLDQEYGLVQPYAGGKAPLPSDEREYMARIAYRF